MTRESHQDFPNDPEAVAARAEAEATAKDTGLLRRLSHAALGGFQTRIHELRYGGEPGHQAANDAYIEGKFGSGVISDGLSALEEKAKRKPKH